MAEPCGCRVYIADENVLQAMGDTVDHCPMHAAAGELEAALEKITALVDAWTMPGNKVLGGGRRLIARAHVLEARTVIAAARSGEPRPDVLGALVTAFRDIQHELGVPGEGYPAPIANAYKIAEDAIGLAAQARGGEA